MPTFDQYEVEPSSAYSGSYTDNAIFGTIFNDAATLANGYTPLGDPNPQTVRRLIGSRIAGRPSLFPNINKMWMPTYMLDGYASGSFLGNQQRFESYYSNEYWYDSYMPNPIDVAQAANVITGGMSSYSAYGIESSGSKFDILPFPIEPDVGIGLMFGTKGTGAGTYISQNTEWENTFPFQSSLKNIAKIFYLDSILSDNYLLSQGLGGAPISPPSSSNIFASVATWFTRFTPPATTVVNINALVGYMNWPDQKWPIPAGGDSLGHYKTFGTAPVNEMFKLFFGFGKGFSSGSNVTRSGPALKIVYGFGTSGYRFNFCHKVEPQGYKYGIRAVEPERTKVIYRIGRYGQLRDVLEGRPNTATLIPAGYDAYNGLPINRTLSFPLQYSFASGSLIYSQSIDYLTATNPDYNPYDSGIYDIYYRSGKPFFDRPNED